MTRRIFGMALGVFAGVSISGGAALADCTPASGSGVTATCSGATTNQAGGAPGTSAGVNGYGTGFETGITIDVLAGSTVTGTNWGLRFDTGTVTNFGAVSGAGSAGIAGAGTILNYGTVTGFNGVSSFSTNLVNYGVITGTNFGVSATTATVTNYGAITGANRGVTGGDITVINSGTITGTSTYAISGSTSVNVTNTGTITSNNVAINGSGTINNAGMIHGGIYALFGNVVTLTNTGTVEVSNASGYAVNVNTLATVTNSGTMIGGIFGTAAVVDNSGTIAGRQVGISVGTATVTNSGTITGTNYGIEAANGSVTNTGTISGRTGVRALAGTGLSLTNAGNITGTNGTAIDFSTSSNDTLTLLPGSRIVGAIKLGSGDAVTMTAGGDTSSLTTFTPNGAYTLNVNGSAPYAISGNQVAIVDPTGFAGSDRGIMDFTRAVSGLLDERGDETQASAGAIAYAADSGLAAQLDDVFAQFSGGAKSDATMFRNASVVTADGGGVWAKGFGGRRVQQADGPTLRSVTGFYGGAIGMDRMVRSDLRLGIYAGAGTTRQSIDANSGSTDSDIVFGGVYGRWSLGAGFFNAALSGGVSRNAITRNIADNLSAGGMQTATADTTGWYVSPELTYGYRIPLGGNLTLTPAAHLRYVAAGLGAYTETGSSSNLTVGVRTMQDLEERSELKLTQTHAFASTAQLRTSVHAGVLGLQRLGGTNVSAVLLGQDLTFAAPGQSSVVGIYAGAGFDLRVAARASLFAAMEYSALSDSSSVLAGKGGLRFVF